MILNIMSQIMLFNEVQLKHSTKIIYVCMKLNPAINCAFYWLWYCPIKNETNIFPTEESNTSLVVAGLVKKQSIMK